MVDKLIILPYAGSTVRDLTPFTDLLEGKVPLEVIEYSGHGSRGREKLYACWDDMIIDVSEQIKRIVDPEKKYAFLGYSMGSLILYELLAQKLIQCRVDQVFFCAHTPHQIAIESDNYYMLSDEEFLLKMQKMGGMRKIEKEMLNNRIFRRLYFAPIRNDFHLIGEYARIKKNTYKPLQLEAHILYSPEDTPFEQICGWDELFDQETIKQSIGHDHFFIWEKGEEMAEYIMNTIEKKVVSDEITR